MYYWLTAGITFSVFFLFVCLFTLQAMLKIEEEHLKLQQERAASEAAMMQAVTAFFSNMTQMFGGHMPSFSRVEANSSGGAGGGVGGGGAGGGVPHGVNPVSGSKSPSNPSSSCSNSPAYSHTYSNPPMAMGSGMNKMHLDGSAANNAHGMASQNAAGHHYPYAAMNQPSPSPSSAPMASPASYPLSPAYQQGVNAMMAANNASAAAAGWYNNGGASAKGQGPMGATMTPTSAPMVVHPFSSDILGIPKNRHDTM